MGTWATRRVVQSHQSLPAKLLLYSIVLAVCWSPRIRLGFLSGQIVDLRLQDLLLAVILVYFALAPGSSTRARWDRVWGRWFMLFTFTALLTTVLHMLNPGPVSDSIRLAYLGRTIEMFLLAICVCGLYLRAGISTSEIGKVLRFGVWFNLAWIAYQYLTGTYRTLFGEVGDTIWSYGPKLLGEPSPFGAGFFLTFAAALTVADYRTGKLSARLAGLTIGVIIVAAVLVESRANLGFILVSLVFFTPTRLRGLINAPLLTLLLLGSLAAVLTWEDDLVGRVSSEGLQGGLGARLEIWASASSYVDNWVLGLGPGGLTPAYIPHVEAHNIAVRAWLDFGVLGATFLLLLLIKIFRASWHNMSSDSSSLRWASTLASLTLLGIFITGMVQDALTAVTSTHLLMVAVGIFAAETSLHIGRKVSSQTAGAGTITV